MTYYGDVNWSRSLDALAGALERHLEKGSLFILGNTECGNSNTL
jgi:hypothetical protein